MKKLGYCFSGTGSGRPYCRDERIRLGVKDNTCVVLDGTQVVFAAEAERFTKKKHDHQKCSEILRVLRSESDIVKNAELSLIRGDDAPNNHHENHIYEVFYQSGFHDAAVLVNDGKGNLEDCCTLAYVEEGKKPVVLKKFDEDSSPSIVYGCFADEIFQVEFAEGKLMGLAAYGKDNGKTYISWNKKKNVIETIPYPEIAGEVKRCMGGTDDVMVARDLAHTVQKNYEDTFVDLIKHFKCLLDSQGFKTENLCMSGGGVLNCPTNSKIIELGLFENYYASPLTSDGCAESVGRAFRNMEFRGSKLKSERLKTPYLGVSYPVSELENPYDVIDIGNPVLYLSEKLKEGSVIAWYQGGAEFGPRALGHRSFLADPTKPEMWDALNRIKGREKWRPFAPIVAERLFKSLFDAENTDMCEYMLRTLDIRDRWKDKLKAVCHVDGTTRPQILKRESNPQLHDLLMTYYEKTGVPCLVNTSLNINGFPIVETPYDFGCLLDEIGFKDDVPEVVGVFVDDDVCYEVGKLEIHQFLLME